MASAQVLPPMPADDVEPPRPTFGLQSLLRHFFKDISLPHPGRFAQKSKESQMALNDEVIPGVSVQVSRNLGGLNVNHVLIMSNPSNGLTPYTYMVQSRISDFVLIGRATSNGIGMATVAGNLTPSLSVSLNGQATAKATHLTGEANYDGSDFSLSLEGNQDVLGLSYLQSVSKTVSIGAKLTHIPVNDMNLYDFALRRATADSFATVGLGFSGLELTYTRLLKNPTVKSQLYLSTEFSASPTEAGFGSFFSFGYFYQSPMSHCSARINNRGDIDSVLEFHSAPGMASSLYLKANILKNTFEPGFGIKLES